MPWTLPEKKKTLVCVIAVNHFKNSSALCFLDNWHHPGSLKWQQPLVCRCSAAATSGKDAARDLRLLLI